MKKLKLLKNVQVNPYKQDVINIHILKKNKNKYNKVKLI